MSDRIEWNIEECKQAAIGLNQQGTLIKNALAGVYNTFRYRISGVWSGKNYNKVVEYVNGFAPDFKSMTEYLGVTIPETIKEIVNAQAENGGIYESFALSSDNNNPDIWTVELSNVSADGAIKIDVEAVNQYITGSQYPSIQAALDLALQYFNNYVNVLEQNIGYFNNNEAIMEAYNTIQNYKSKFENDTRNMIDTIVDAANQEISGITDVDLKTQQDAHKIENGDSSATNIGSSVSGNSVSGNSVSGNTPVGGSGKYKDSNSSAGSSVSGNSVSGNTPVGGSGKYKDSNSSGGSSVSGNSVSINYKSSAAEKYQYNPNEDWEKMSSENRVKRAYMNAKAYDSQYGEEFRDKMVEGMPLTDSERQKVNDLIEKSNTTIQPEEYQAASYDKNSSWKDLNAEQRVSKALDNPDYVKELSDSEMKSLNEAQHKLGEHVSYVGEEAPYEVNPDNLNERQKVQWAIDIRNDQVDSGNNPSGYEKKISSVLTADQMAEVDTEARYYSNVKYGQDNNNYYTFTEDDV